MSEPPHELLERAADRLEKATTAFAPEKFWQREIEHADMTIGADEWAKMMGPRVAKPLMAWLRKEARHLREFGYRTHTQPAALEFARTILGEQAA